MHNGCSTTLARLSASILVCEDFSISCRSIPVVDSWIGWIQALNGCAQSVVIGAAKACQFRDCRALRMEVGISTADPAFAHLAGAHILLTRLLKEATSAGQLGH